LVHINTRHESLVKNHIVIASLVERALKLYAVES